TAYLCAGLFIWQFISEAASTACTVLVDSQGFIRQTNVPMIVYPAVSLISSFVTFLVGLTALVLGLILFSTPTWWSIPLMIPGLLLLALFGWGVVCIQSVVGAVVRDHQHITSIALLALFFTTPIMYPVAVMDRVGQTWLYQYNPLYYLLTTVRHPLLRGELPPAGVYGVAAAFALGVAVVGHLLFCRVDRRVVRYL
ncbi:MAG: ABC transporter permease, partial [Planctomycetota bacterium]